MLVNHACAGHIGNTIKTYAAGHSYIKNYNTLLTREIGGFAQLTWDR